MSERDIRRLWVGFWGIMAPILLAACASKSTAYCEQGQFVPVANPPVMPIPGQIDYCPPATIGIPSWATATPFPTEAATAIETQGEVYVATPNGATPEIYVPDMTPTPEIAWDPSPVNILYANSAEVEQEADQDHDLFVMVEQTEGGPVLVVVPKEQALRDGESVGETAELAAEGIDRVQRSLDMEAEEAVVTTITTASGEPIDIHGNIIDQGEMEQRLINLGGNGAGYLYLKQSPEGGDSAILEPRTIDLEFAKEGLEMGENVREGLARVLSENGLSPVEIESLLFLHFGSSANGYAEKWHSDVEIAIVQKPDSRDIDDLNYKIDGILRDPDNWQKIWDYSGIDQSGFMGIHVLHVQVNSNYDAEMSTVHKIEPGVSGGSAGLSVVAIGGLGLPRIVGQALELEDYKKKALAKLRTLIVEMTTWKKGVRDGLRRGDPKRLWTHVIPDLQPLSQVAQQEAAVIALGASTVNKDRLSKQMSRIGLDLESNCLLFEGVMGNRQTPINKNERDRVMFWRELKSNYPDLFARLRTIYSQS